MSQSADPVREALARYSAAAHDKDLEAFVSLYADHQSMKGKIQREERG